jgi:phosphoglycolate phosphatase-like HAD superfamily hydrolase
MEDAALKPDPAPVRFALRKLGVASAWMIGDTPDDLVSARAAGVVPIGCVAPGELRERVEAILLRAGAARVLDNAAELSEILP